jgi:hypothetical protein
MEILDLNIHYFDRDYFFEYLNSYKQGKVKISPLDLNWDHFLKQQEKKECVILDKFEFKTDNIRSYLSHKMSISILENDFLWLESIVPLYENGNTITINTNRLFSISSLKEASNTFKSIFKDKYRHNFAEDWFLDKLFIILNREKKLKELNFN